MIKSTQQKNRTLESIAKFEEELQHIKASTELDEIVKEVIETGHMSLISELKAEVEEYEKLVKNEYIFPDHIPITELPKYLTKIRISKGISQSDLAKKINKHKQQINKYEEHDYQSINWSTIIEIIEALGISKDLEITLEESSKKLTPIQLQQETDKILENIEKLVSTLIKKHNDIRIESIIFGLNILEREAIMGLLFLDQTSIDSFKKSFKEEAGPIFIKHNLEVNISFITLDFSSHKEIETKKKDLKKIVNLSTKTGYCRELVCKAS